MVSTQNFPAVQLQCNRYSQSPGESRSNSIESEPEEDIITWVETTKEYIVIMFMLHNFQPEADAPLAHNKSATKAQRH